MTAAVEVGRSTAVPPKVVAGSNTQHPLLPAAVAVGEPGIAVAVPSTDGGLVVVGIEVVGPRAAGPWLWWVASFLTG